MHHSLSTLFDTYQQNSEDLRKAFHTFLGASPIVERVNELTDDFQEEWRTILDNGGFQLPTIAFVGPFNAGKSFLIRCLIQHPEADRHLSIGNSDHQATERFLWIGSESPSRSLDPKREQHWKLSPGEMANLGMAEGYMLLDTPGSGDFHQHNQQLAELALSSAQLKVLVIPHSKSREAGYLEYIQQGDGSLILPVINRCRFGEDPEQEQTELTEKVLERLHHYAPHSEILTPLFLPDLDFKSTSRSFDDEDIRIALTPALQHALADPQRLRLSLRDQLKASYQCYLHTLQQTLSPVLTSRLAGLLDELQQEEQQLPAKAIRQLQEDPQQVRLVIKRQLRGDLLEQIPLWAFPYRTFTGILALTSGAWDRLTLSAAGSLPSLITTGFHSLKNQKQEREASDFLYHQLKQRMASRIRESLHPLLSRFREQVEQITRQQIANTTRSTQEIDFEIHGVHELADQWLQDVTETTRQHRWKWGITLLPLLATLVFLFMVAAPLFHVYSQYLPAALESFQGQHAQAAQLHYPILSFGFWGSTLFLSAIPVFLLSMLSVCLALRKKRIQHIEKELQQKLQHILSHPHLNFEIQLKDPQIQAARTVLTRPGNCRTGAQRGTRTLTT